MRSKAAAMFQLPDIIELAFPPLLVEYFHHICCSIVTNQSNNIALCLCAAIESFFSPPNPDTAHSSKTMASSEPPPFPDISLRTRIIVLIAVLLPLTIIVVALRIATRILIFKRLGWDDWTIIFALVGLL